MNTFAGVVVAEGDPNVRRIQVITDPATDRVLSNALEGLGYEVSCTAALDEASNAVVELNPFLAVIETESTPLALIRELRHLKQTMCIVVVTAFGSIHAARAAIEAGADDYLTKPAVAAEVLAVAATRVPVPAGVDRLSLQEARDRYIDEVFHRFGTLAETARALRLHPRSLRRMIRV